ncbi:MAG: hypothetical protein HY881_01190 [Deltaproteobacteria bacterium]|nr:hypothetical protein [Deltaproteobacteria bacterium]
MPAALMINALIGQEYWEVLFNINAELVSMEKRGHNKSAVKIIQALPEVIFDFSQPNLPIELHERPTDHKQEGTLAGQ